MLQSLSRILLITAALLSSSTQLLAEQPLTVAARPIPSGVVFVTVYTKGQGDIYRLNMATGAAEPVINSPANEEYGVPSPDGKSIVFTRGVEGQRDIFIAPLDDPKSEKQLTQSPGDDDHPSWSPDGKQIVFHTARFKKGQNLALMQSDGSDVRQLTKRSTKNSVPRFSPDGKMIIFSTSEHWPGWDIEGFVLDTGEIRSFTSGMQTTCRGSFDPTGTWFAFSRGSSPVHIHRMEVASGKESLLFERAGKNYDVEILPNGAGLFFSGERESEGGKYDLYYFDFASKVLTRVTAGAESVRYPNVCKGCS